MTTRQQASFLTLLTLWKTGCQAQPSPTSKQTLQRQHDSTSNLKFRPLLAVLRMYSVWALISYYIRPIIKWFLRKTTGLCELQRICYGEVSGAPRVKAVERSLTSSRSPQIHRMISHLNSVCVHGRFHGENQREIVKGVVSTVLVVKKINPKIHFQFVKSFGACVEQIWGYRQVGDHLGCFVCTNDSFRSCWRKWKTSEKPLTMPTI